MANKPKAKTIPPTPKMTKQALANEKPLKLNMSFEDAIRKIINTPSKKRLK